MSSTFSQYSFALPQSPSSRNIYARLRSGSVLEFVLVTTVSLTTVCFGSSTAVIFLIPRIRSCIKPSFVISCACKCENSSGKSYGSISLYAGMSIFFSPFLISARYLLHSFLTHTALKYSGFVPITTITFEELSAANMYGSYAEPSLSSRVILAKNTLKPS